MARKIKGGWILFKDAGLIVQVLRRAAINVARLCVLSSCLGKNMDHRRQHVRVMFQAEELPSRSFPNLQTSLLARTFPPSTWRVSLSLLHTSLPTLIKRDASKESQASLQNKLKFVSLTFSLLIASRRRQHAEHAISATRSQQRHERELSEAAYQRHRNEKQPLRASQGFRPVKKSTCKS